MISLPRPSMTMALLAYALLALQGCAKTPAEDIVRSQIEDIAMHIEAKKPEQVIDLIHDNFQGKNNYDKAWIKRTLLFHTLRHQNVKLVTSNIQTTLKAEDTIVATFNALATGGKGLLPERGAIYRVESEWRFQDGDWLVVYAKWEKQLGVSQ